MASPTPLPEPEQGPPPADPASIRACLSPRLAAVFEAEWAFVLDKTKESKNLAEVHDFIRGWRHIAHAEMREPGSYFRTVAKAEQIARTGANPDARSIDEMRALLEDRLGR